MKHTLFFSCIFVTMQISAQSFEVSKLEENPYTFPVYYTEFVGEHTIAFSGIDSNIHLLDLSKCKSPTQIKGLFGKPDAFAFSSDQKWIASTSIDNEIKCWTGSGKPKHSVGEYAPGYVSGKQLVFTPDNQAFTTNQGCDFLLWSTKSGKLLDTVQATTDECCNTLAFSADGHRAYVGGNSYVWLYNLTNNTFEMMASTSELSVVTSVALSPDQKWLAVAGREGFLLMTADLKVKYKLIGHTDWINSVRFSPDGKYLYSCSGTIFGKDRTVRIWDVSTGKSIGVMEGHLDDVNAIAVSSNGKYIVSSSMDHTLKIWHTETQKLVCTVVPMRVNGKIEVFYYTPDGIFFGPENFYSLVKISKAGKNYNAEELVRGQSRKKLCKVLGF